MVDSQPDDLERLLPPSTGMGAPTLNVGDIEAMTEYYSTAFALHPLEDRGTRRGVHRVLGRGTVPMMKLISEPDLPLPGRHEAGLFHTAFVFATPSGLASTVYQAAQHPSTRFVGASDHLVSEAFYFTDPEGNGVELYWDRPRSTWQYDHGQVIVASDPLDANGFLREHLDPDAVEQEGDGAGRVGHVHLQVGDVAAARPFYVDALGFAVTQSSYPGALFASAGGYHHHVAVNTWNSKGAGPRAATLGLSELAIGLADREALDALRARLRSGGLIFDDDGVAVTLHDPWGTRVTVTATEQTIQDVLHR